MVSVEHLMRPQVEVYEQAGARDRVFLAGELDFVRAGDFSLLRQDNPRVLVDRRVLDRRSVVESSKNWSACSRFRGMLSSPKSGVTSTT